MTSLPALRRAAVGAALIVTLAACSSTATPSSTSSPTAVASAAPATVASAIPTTAATSAPTVLPTAVPAKVAVDLVFTGSHPFVAKGSAGQCLGGGFFEFIATEADYPGFGQGFEVSNDALTGPFLKWAADTYAYGRAYKVVNNVLVFTTVMSFSADGRTMQINGPLAPFTGPNGTSGPESVSGTITCP